MRRVLAAVILGAALVVVPAALASPTVRLAIVHTVRGCHEWATVRHELLGPARTLTVKRGTALEIRVNCPMSFDVVQTAGPRLGVAGRWQPGTARTLRFAKPGVYKLRAANVESSEEKGFQTLGPDNAVFLTVRVTR